MTAKEMHIQVKQGLQETAASKKRGFFPEEIDLALNTVYGRFIKSSLRAKEDGSGGFELDQVGTDKIRTLIRRETLQAYVNNELSYYCDLPNDYAYLLEDASKTQLICGSYVEQEIQENVTIKRILFPKSSISSSPFYANVKFSDGTNTIEFPGTLGLMHMYAGFKYKEDFTYLINYIINNSSAYWSRMGKKNMPGNLFIKTTNPIQLEIDGTLYVETATIQEIRKKHYNEGNLVTNRLTASNSIQTLNDTKYSATSSRSPISELAGNVLLVHRKKNFTVNTVDITYIKKFQAISLSLGTECELPEEFHTDLCDLAVEYLKNELMSDKGTAMKQAEISKRVIL